VLTDAASWTCDVGRRSVLIARSHAERGNEDFADLLLGLLLDAKLVEDHGWKCTAAIVLGIALLAAAQSISGTDTDAVPF
jgi:hypothetical protein